MSDMSTSSALLTQIYINLIRLTDTLIQWNNPRMTMRGLHGFESETLCIATRWTWRVPLGRNFDRDVTT